MRRPTWWRVAGMVCLLAVVNACNDSASRTPTAPSVASALPSGTTQLGLSAAFDSYAFLPFVLDDAGPNDNPAQTDLNSFSRADNVAGKLGLAFTWDDVDSWTGTGQTGDACALFDTDSPANGFANYALCVRITNTPDGLQVLQLPAGQSPIIYSCGDKKTDRCSQPVTAVPLKTSFCEVVKTTEAFPGMGDDGQDVLAACSIDLSAMGNATKSNILNVCSFPSGSPNSNAFDCVVTPGAGFLRIVKKTTPDQSGLTFNFTLSPAATNGTTSFSLTDNGAGDETTALIPVNPGNFSLTEVNIPTGWALSTAACLRSGTATGSKSGNAINTIGVTIGETTVCTFQNVIGSPSLRVAKTATPTSIPQTGGSVSYDVVVTNNSIAAVTLSTLTDDRFGDLNGQGTCVTGGTIAAGGSYSCSFSKTLAPAAANSTHTNVVTATVTNPGGSASSTDDAVVTYTDVAPTLTVTKTASPTSVPETGGTVTYTVDVKNTSAESVTLTILTDDKFGALGGQGTCATGGSIAAGATYSCSFAKTVSGDAAATHVNTVSATVKDNDNTTATATDDATVTFTNVAPTVSVTKTATPTSLPETGGSVTYTVQVTNTAAEPVTLKSLADDKFGNLNGQGTCTTGGIIAAGGSYSCAFSKTISGTAGTTHTNVVTTTVEDNEKSQATATDDATVAFTDVLPSITVTKSASPTSVPETGGTVTYTVQVHNDGSVPVTLTALSDDKFGNLVGAEKCFTTAPTIAVGTTYTCTFTRPVSGNAGTSHVNTVTATAHDDDGNIATGHDDATVTFTDVLPNISVTKTANPTSLSTVGTGTLNFTADRTFTASTPPPPGGFQYASPTCDDAGPNDQPAQVDLNCFNRADNVSGKLGVRWTWDDINSWTGTGQTGDGCALFDTDNDGNANVAVCARITNTPDGQQVTQVPNAGAADVYLCNDTKSDRCAKQVTKLSNVLTTTCTIAKVSEAFPGVGDDGADVQASCSIDLGMQGFSGITSIDLLNVCSFPSGEPNSNPFDCVVSVGAGFIQLVKVANPTTTQLFGFTLSPGSTDGTSKYAVQGGVTTGLIPVTPGNNAYSLTETLPSFWGLTGVSCSIDGVSTGTANVAQNKITGITVKTGQTTVCTFTNAGLITGNVTYTVTVTNLSAEAAALDVLSDDKFGNLNGVGTCATGGSIAGSGSYSCQFTKTLTGAVGTSHTNTVTATAKDNDGNSTSKTASATVSFVSSP